MKAHVPAMERQPHANGARPAGGAHAAMADNRPNAILQRQQIAIIHQGVQARPVYQRVHGGVVQARMDSFGNTNRNVDINPDLLDEDAGGIHRVPDEDMRPEDAPLTPALRINLHKFHSAKLYMEQMHPDMLAGFIAENDVLMNGAVSLKQRFLQIAGAIKDASKDHKKRVKDLASNSTIANLNQTYTDTLNQLSGQASAMAVALKDYINAHIGDDEDEKTLDEIHVAGTDIWRTRWHAAILAVNGVLEVKWPGWADAIVDWITTKRDVDGLAYMDPASPVGIDYIGSLAKGYKGPPKQSIRFTPEKFDVDANLTSLPLAAWAIQTQHAIIDRGRIWSKVTGPLFDEVLEPMQDDIQQGLVDAGLIDLGMDPGEPFEAVIDTEGLEAFAGAGGAGAAVAGVRLSQRDLAMRNSLYTLRHTNPARMARIGLALDGGGFSAADGHGHSFLTEHNEANQTYAFSNDQLDQIEDIIANTL